VSGHKTDTSWGDRIPGANEPVAAEPSLQRFMRRKEVLTACSLSNSELYALVSEGRFPTPFKLTGTTANNERGGVMVWIQSEIAQWQAERIASRDATTPANS